jgi:hypothetical protein
MFSLQQASNLYHRVLTKKKDCDALDEPGKLLPIDALGMVMILHGEEFREDSVFGSRRHIIFKSFCTHAADVF